MEAITFTNFSSEDFVGVYAKKEYRFKAGQSMMLEDYLAEHFAKHLIDREINRMGRKTNDEMLRSELLSKCLVGNEEEVESEPEVTAKILKNKKEATKKVVKSTRKEEDEFEGK